MESDKKRRVLFLCTDNVGRSVIAEYCLRQYLKLNQIDNIEVTSAGTNAKSDTSGFSMAHITEMQKLGIDASGHERTQLNQDIIDNSEFIICMARNHQEWLRERFDIDAPLFNEIFKNESSDILVTEPGSTKNLDERMIEITHYIQHAMPKFVENLK